MISVTLTSAGLTVVALAGAFAVMVHTLRK